MAGIVGVLALSLGARLALPLLLGHFADDALEGAATSRLTALALVYVAAALGAALLDLVVVWWSARVSWRAGNRLRERLAAHALRLEPAWHGRHSPGELIERIDGDVEAMTTFFADIAVRIAGNVALIAGMLVLATTIDPWAGLVLTLTALAGAATMVRLRVAAVGAREAEREVNAQLYGDLEERLGGLEDLRANGAGRYAVHRLLAHSARPSRAAPRSSLRGDGAHAAAAGVFGVGTAATIGVGVALQQRGVVTVVAVLSLYRFADMLRRPLEQVAEQLNELQKALAGARRAAGLLATEPAIRDGRDDGGGLPAGALAGELEHVTFAYRADDGPVVREGDLRRAPGRRPGLGRPPVPGQSDDDRLRDVLAQVGLGDWLAALPDGLDTPLAGSDGLSAGEAQLLAFARAFLADPAVVVLDEPSSRLDRATERRVEAATEALLAGRTAIVIAHRLATLDRMDEIAVLEDGRVVEHGRREDLARSPTSRYARLRRAGAPAAADPLEEVAP